MKPIRENFDRLRSTIMPLLLRCGSVWARLLTAQAQDTRQTGQIPVDNPHLVYRGTIQMEVVPFELGAHGKAVRFNRILNLHEGKQYGWDNPGVRISFRTDATSVTAKLYYSTKHSSTSARNGKGVFFIDRKTNDDWYFNTTNMAIIRSPESVDLIFPGAAAPGFHDYEIVLPYGDSVEFLGLILNDGARMETFTPHAEIRYVAYGDSITHGFTASGIDTTYAFMLAEINAWHLFNLGIGGRSAVPGDGEVIGSLQADIISILMGVNDWQANRDPEVYRAHMTALLREIRALQPGVPIYVITPLWVDPSWHADAVYPIEHYRVVLRELAGQLGDPDLHIIEGPDLIDHDKAYFDRVAVHPNDAGFALMAERLSALIPAPAQ